MPKYFKVNYGHSKKWRLGRYNMKSLVVKMLENIIVRICQAFILKTPKVRKIRAIAST